jgi:hypothetical protein
MPPASRVGTASAARSSLLRSMDQFSAFVAPSACMGPPLTESPGWCQVIERKWHTAEPHRGKHDRAPSHSRWNGKCSKEWRGQVHRHQVPARHQLWLRRASGAPSEDHWQVADIGSTNDIHKATTSRVTAGPMQGSGLQGQVTTATPFAPRSWPSGGPTGVISSHRARLDVNTTTTQRTRIEGAFGWHRIGP